jgi:hypothetical protein
VLGVKRASTKKTNIRFSIGSKLDFPICPIIIHTISDGNERQVGNGGCGELK